MDIQPVRLSSRPNVACCPKLCMPQRVPPSGKQVRYMSSDTLYAGSAVRKASRRSCSDQPRAVLAPALPESQPLFETAEKYLAEMQDVSAFGSVALVTGGLIGESIVGVMLTARIVESVLDNGKRRKPFAYRQLATEVLTTLREAAPAVGLIIAITGGVVSLNSRIESLTVQVNAQNTRVDALNVRADAELRTLAEQTSALRAVDEQIFRLALRQAQDDVMKKT